MYLTSALNTATVGINNNLQQFNDAAQRIARDPMSESLAADVVDLKIAQHGVQANIAVIKQTGEMFGTLLDVLA